MNEEQELMTLTQVAEYLKVSLSQVYRWLDREEDPIPVIYVSDRTKRVRRDDLLKWLEEQKAKAKGVQNG